MPLLVKEGKRGGFVLQPKCDGLSLEIQYNEGRLVDAITRGDGLVGDVITQNVVKMQNFTEKTTKPFTGSIRCEIVVTFNDFKKLNSLIQKENPPLSRGGQQEGFAYSNSRNAASGISQRLDSRFSEFCSLLAVDIFPFRQSTELEKISLLKILGFTPVETFHCHNLDKVETIYQDFLIKKRQSYPFDIDGLVVKINDLKIQQSLGSHANHPKGQIAYKFPAQSNQTVIKSINWQVGPMGSVTPVAEVEPIELSNAIISFASLGNYDLVKQKNINIGDIIKISRRGDVIPHIENVVIKVTPGYAPIPTHCPSCQNPLIIEDKYLHCPNTNNCLPQVIGALNLFCQRLEILGLSEKTITKLYLANKIKLPGDFYQLTIDNIKDLDNLGEKSAANIVYQIQSKKTLSLAEAFNAAIIPNFSSARIKQIIDAGFDTPEKVLNITINQLESLPGIQSTLAKKIFDGIQLRKNWISSILSQVQIINYRLPITVYRLQNLNFAITGQLSAPRKNIEQLIESHGGKIVSAVTSHTDYLITNETSSSSDKFKSAKKFNTKIITEDQLHQLLHN